MDEEIMAEFQAIAEMHADNEREARRARRRERILNQQKADARRYLEHVRRMRKLFAEADAFAAADQRLQKLER